MSHNGTLNISRDDAGECRRVFILKNTSGSQGGKETPNNNEGRGMVSSSPTLNYSTAQHESSAQHGVSVSETNSDSDNVINGMLRSGEDVDPSSDLGADLQHIDEWLKTRSDSLSSFDFDPDIKPSEIDVNDFLSLKSGNVQLNVGGQDYGLVVSRDGPCEAGNSLHSQLSFPDLGESLCGNSSRRNSFTKKLETFLQVDKGLFEELLLTDPSKKHGYKRSENGLSLQAEDRGLFEELLLPGGQEDWARQAQELLLAVSLEKKENEVSDSGSIPEGGDALSREMNCSVSLPDSAQETSESENPVDLDLMVNNIQPIKLMSPQEIENMASRPLGFEETPIKTEEQRNREVSRRLEDEDFNFYPFGGRPTEDGNSLTADLLTSPNSEVDSKLSSILAMDASNDPLEMQSTESNDMLESLSKTPPKMERSISPGTFLVKLEPRENQDLQNKSNQDTQNKATPVLSVVTSSQQSAIMPPPTSVIASTPTLSFSPFLSPSVLDVSDITTTAMLGVETSTVSSSQVPITAFTNAALVTPTTSSVTTPVEGINVSSKGLLKIPSGLVQAAFKKFPVCRSQSKVTGAIPTINTIATTTVTSTTTSVFSPLTTPALIIRPFAPNIQQQQKQRSQPQTIIRGEVSGTKDATIPLTLTPLKVVALPTCKAGTANVTITVDRKANLTIVNIVSSNNEQTVFKINTCDLVRAVSSIREPQLDPLGLSPQQLLRYAHTAHRLIQEVHQQGAARSGKSGKKEPYTGPQNFEINQVIQELKAPISRMQQNQLAFLRQATAVGTAEVIATTSSKVTPKNEVRKGITTSSITSTVSPSFLDTATAVGSTPVLNTSMESTSQAMSLTGSVILSGKGNTIKSSAQKFQTESLPSSSKLPRLANIAIPDKTNVKNEGLGVSLRPGAPPTMVSVPSVLDTLSASSLLSADLLQDSSQSASSKHLQSDDEVNEENPEMCTDEVANKALEELGIQIDSLVYELSPQGGKRWLCPIKGCSKHFPKISSLKVHLLSHNGIRPYKCNYENCDWAFYTWYKLKRHIETHLKRRDYACSEVNCNRRFTTIYNLNTHIRLHQRPKCWMCSVPGCSWAYHTRRELEVHMKTHKDVEAPYKCEVKSCGKSYFTPNSLTSHMRSHHKAEELCCQWNGCGKKFDKPCRLKAHMRVHTGQRPFVCNFELEDLFQHAVMFHPSCMTTPSYWFLMMKAAMLFVFASVSTLTLLLSSHMIKSFKHIVDRTFQVHSQVIVMLSVVNKITVFFRMSGS
ncbi:hypothetical protein SK128_022029 [Halocaridina rubra]|uniref:C2H2-type domain-containing protein n=1 Tax=Halocaridina rubra TaxID=373956 RepID=A0AAN8X1K4_HALRR